MTSRDRIKAIAEIIAPNPHFREERRIRNGWPLTEKAIADQNRIRTAWRKAEAIDAAVYGAKESAA